MTDPTVTDETLLNPVMVIKAGSGPVSPTAVCLGVYRGGTSMIACVLHWLGVYMGFGEVPPEDEWMQTPGSHYWSYEDREVAPLLANVDLVGLLAYIQKRNEQCAGAWGWKSGITLPHIKSILPYLRNPHFIVVLRDPVACMQHENVWFASQGEPPPTPRLEYVERQLFPLLDFVRDCAHPLCLVSYERAVRAPSLLVSELMEFLHLPSSVNQQGMAVSKVARWDQG